MRKRQPTLPSFEKVALKEFGGTTRQFRGRPSLGNPRDARPVSCKRPLHLVLRSTQARGSRSFLHPSRARRIEALARTLGNEKGVRVYRYANAGNHLHLVVKPDSRRAYAAYVRALSGIVARLTLGKERGPARRKASHASEARDVPSPASKAAPRFWDARPYTRIVEWGRDFKTACSYVRGNELEATGFGPRRAWSSRARAGPAD